MGGQGKPAGIDGSIHSFMHSPCGRAVDGVSAPARGMFYNEPMAVIEPRFRPLFAALFAVFVVFGTSMTIIGATLPKLLADFSWSYLAAGVVLGAGAVAYFCTTFVAGHLVKRWGAQVTIVAGLVIDAVGLTFFAMTPSPLVNTLLGALIGVGQGCVEIGVNWSTLGIDREGNGRAMNLMHGAFALGAIVGPLSVGVLISQGFDWIAVYRGMALVFALLALVVLAGSFRPLHEHRTSARRERLPTRPAYWLSFVALFFYVGVELGVSNWIAQYFVEVFSYSAAAGALLVALFWGGLLAGRFGVPLLKHGRDPAAILIALSLIATLAIVLLCAIGYFAAGAAPTSAALVLVAVAGFGCSVYYPEVITIVGRCFPEAQGQAIGFAATGGGVGAFVFPFLMSAFTQHWGIHAGFASYAILAIAMSASAVALARAAARQRASATRNR
jgi:fucose permease